MFVTDAQGFVWNVSFSYEKEKRRHPVTICRMKKVATGEIVEGTVKCFLKEDFYQKWYGRRMAFGHAIKKIAPTKAERNILWKEYFRTIKNDPHREDFIRANYPATI